METKQPFYSFFGCLAAGKTRRAGVRARRSQTDGTLGNKKTKGTCIWFLMKTSIICTNLLKIAVNAAAPSQFALALSIASNCFN